MSVISWRYSVEYLLVDPSNRTLTVLRLTPEGYVVQQVEGDAGSVALPPFDAVAIDLSIVFPPPAAP